MFGHIRVRSRAQGFRLSLGQPVPLQSPFYLSGASTLRYALLWSLVLFRHAEKNVLWGPRSKTGFWPKCWPRKRVNGTVR